MVSSFGLGAMFTGVTTAANAGVSEDKAGLAAGLLNSGSQLGAALGLAVLSAVATAVTTSALHAGHALASATTEGYQRALLVGAFVLLGAGVIALFSSNERQTAPSESMEVVTDAA
jgi:hypothetical protein